MMEYVSCGFAGITSGLGGLGGGRGVGSVFLRFFEFNLGFGGAEGLAEGTGAGGGGECEVRDEGGEWEIMSTDGERIRAVSSCSSKGDGESSGEGGGGNTK